MYAKELIQRYEAGERDFKGVVLDDEDLEAGSNLQKSDLRNTDLSDVDLSEVNLSDANLQYADLSRAILFQANLENADLDYADLTDADLEQANLANAQTRMTIFCNTTMPDGSVRDDGCIEGEEDEEIDDE